MTDLKVETNSEKVARAFREAPKLFIDELARAITEGSMLLEREIRERTPTSGAGILRESIGAMPVQVGEKAVTGAVATSLSYAGAVELGAKPHWMPIAPLEDWVRRKLAKRADEVTEVARMIWYKIAHRGTKGHFMFRDGIKATSDQILAMLDRAAANAIEKMEASAR